MTIYDVLALICFFVAGYFTADIIAWWRGRK